MDFIATKLEAIAGRGDGDFVASHDLEDVVAVIDGRVEIADELRAHDDRAVVAFISSTLSAFLNDEAFVDAIPGFLLPDPASQARAPELLRRLRTLGEQ